MSRQFARWGRNYRKLFVASTISNLGDGISLIAYPWLASAITRNPLLIALVAVVQRLPWLVFTLPAGVITDRYDRRLLMSGANAVRFVLTAFVAGAVFVRRDALPAPDAVEQVAGTETLLYLLLLGATLLLGVCEVLHDNSAQTFMPSLVADEHLERANGRLYSAETRRQPVRRAAARRPAAGGRVRPAVRRRRRHVRRLGSARVLDRRHRQTERAPMPARGRSGGRRSPRGSAGSGTTPCCARWPSRSGRSTCGATSASPCS